MKTVPEAMRVGNVTRKSRSGEKGVLRQNPEKHPNVRTRRERSRGGTVES